MIRFSQSLLKESARVIAIPLFLFGAFAAALAFTEPSVAPTGGIVFPPVNTGGVAQTKSGNFTSSGTVTGNIVNGTTQMCLAGSCITSWGQATLINATPGNFTFTGPGVSQLGSTFTFSGGGGGVSSVNGATGALTFTGPGVSQLGNTFTFSGGGAGGLTGLGTLNFVSKWTGSASLGNSVIFDNGTNVGIGTTLPSTKLHIIGSGLASRNFYIQSPFGPSIIVGIGELSAATADWPGKTLYGIGWDAFSGAVGALIPVGATFGIYGNGGTANLLVTGNATINGSVTVVGVKAFQIPHPLDPKNKYLVHASLEGPEAGVYYRGQSQLENGRAEIILPSYFEALTRKEDRTVLLTNVDGGDALWVATQDGTQVKDGKFIVLSSNQNSSQKFNWEVKAVRADIAPLQIEVQKESK